MAAAASPTATPTSPAATPPTVVGAQAVHTRKKGLTAVVVTFSEPMAPVRVADLNAYSLTTTAGRGRRQHSVPVAISGAFLNAQGNTVTLTLARPLRQGPLSLAIGAGNVAAQNGATLAANFSIRVA